MPLSNWTDGRCLIFASSIEVTNECHSLACSLIDNLGWNSMPDRLIRITEKKNQLAGWFSTKSCHNQIQKNIIKFIVDWLSGHFLIRIRGCTEARVGHGIPPNPTVLKLFSHRKRNKMASCAHVSELSLTTCCSPSRPPAAHCISTTSSPLTMSSWGEEKLSFNKLSF